MGSTFAFYAILSAMNLCIGLYVLVRAPRTAVNHAFGFFGCTIALWTVAIGLAYSRQAGSLPIVRLTFATASLMLLGLLTLVVVFPASPLPRHFTYYAFAAAGLLFCAVSFTPFIVRDAYYGPAGITLAYGQAHRLFGVYVYATLAYCLLALVRKFSTATGFVKLQLRYLLLGALLPGLAVTITNLLVPLVFRDSRFGRYGPAFTIIFLGLTAHALIRHRLMNIRLAISRSVAYVLALACSAVAFVLLVWSASALLVLQPMQLPLWVQLALIFPIAFLFHPVRLLFQAALDRYLYRRPYDYEKTVRETGRLLAATLDLPSLLHSVADVIRRTVSPEHVAIYIAPSEGAGYTLTAFHSVVQSSLCPRSEQVPPTSPLVSHQIHGRAPLIRDDLARDADNPFASSLLSELASLDAEYVHPLFDNDRLIGFLVLGPKLSGDPYFSEDLNLLATLVAQAAIAVKNAQLYHEVLLVNEYVENILSTMDSAVIAADGNARITLFNSAAARITGLDPDRAKHTSVDILPPSLAALLRATLEDRLPRAQLEILIPAPSGDVIPALCSTSPFTTSSGNLLGVVAVFSDLSRLKQLEAEKQRAERLAAVGALASGIAHEIKNPLVAIRTFAELLPERFADDDFRTDFARVVIREISRIDDLVARLRGLAAPPPRPLSPLDITIPITETLALLRARLEQGDITVETQLDADLPPIAGDIAQLKQLFLNTFVNAIEAMDPGGTLIVRAIRPAGVGAEKLVVEISDTGCGISRELLEKVFDPFVTTKANGSGLGLSISRGIADAHRATIRARNNDQMRGATITIEFPVTRLDQEPAILG